MREAGLFQPREAFQPIGVDRSAWRYIVFEKGEQSLSSEVGDHGHACTSGEVSAAFLYSGQDQCSFPAFQLTAASFSLPGCRQPMYHQPLLRPAAARAL